MVGKTGKNAAPDGAARDESQSAGSTRLDAKKTAVLLGDESDAPYHPLSAVSGLIEEIVSPLVRLRVETDYAILEKLACDQVLICYADRWNRPLTRRQEGGFLSALAGGARVLVIHNGISLATGDDSARALGARFTGHPPYQRLDFVRTEAKHPITEALPERWTLEEEPYRFEFVPFAPRTVLYSYENEGQVHPAAWVQTFGLGRTVFLMPGHHAPSFRNEIYAGLIRASLAWLLADQAEGEADANAR